MFGKSYKPWHPSTAKRVGDDPIVKNGLSISPAEMDELMKKGMPVAAQMNAMFNDDKISNNDFDVPLEHMRGIDIAEINNTVLDIREKAKSVVKRVATGEIATIEKGVD